MKRVKLNTAKLLFLVALLCPVAFADPGDQGSGGFADSDVLVTKTSDSSLDGDQGSGGFTASAANDSYIDIVIRSASEYFDWLMQ